MHDNLPDIPHFGMDAFRTATGVDDLAISRLKRYAEILLEWNTRLNLVSAGSLGDLWHRHIFDSAQLAELIPEQSRTLIDIGSGAGFPALVVAALLQSRGGFHVTMIESIEKKCAFLRAAADTMELGSRVTIQRSRAEDLTGMVADVVTARAVASLEVLLSYAQRFTGKSTLCLFPKGRTAADELTQARRSWRIEAELIPSRSDPESSIVAVTSFSFKGRRP